MGENMIFKQAVEDWPDEIVVHTDGASRGNPGPASTGVVGYNLDGEILFEYAEHLGEQTNNYAEYFAVLRSFQLSLDKGVKRVTLRSDSQLLVRQLLGEYKVKSETLRPLYLECSELMGRFEKANIEHVRREQNKKADQLANLALDRMG
ncbi:MAG: ribonuclease H [Bdellovibrionaceae bacterium]|nr:ribonuclease H [Pseudobdellovibrionaceae bacterium]